MATLPLFSPSFMPKDGASFASSRATTSSPSDGTPESRAKPPVPRNAERSNNGPLMRSLFDPLPSPVARGRVIRSDVPGDVRDDVPADVRSEVVTLPPIVVSTQTRRVSIDGRSFDETGPDSESVPTSTKRFDASSFATRPDPSSVAAACDALPSTAERHDAPSIVSTTTRSLPFSSVPVDATPTRSSSTADDVQRTHPAVAERTTVERAPHVVVGRTTAERASHVVAEHPNHAVAERTTAAVRHTEAALREAGLAGRFWRGDSLSTTSLSSVPSGFRPLDEQLPDGGWPSGCMTELLLARTGVGEIRFLAATLAALTQAGREIVLLGPPHIPDPTGWEQLGIDMRRVLIVRTPQPVDRLWALEQSLKSSAFGALLAWLPEERTLARPDALRRLQLAAASANGLTFVFRPAAAEFQPSPAPLRLALATGRPDGARRTLAVRLLKRRGPVLVKPLTLPLPEVLHGMRAFPTTEPERAATSRAGVRSSPPSVRPATVAHALAGPLLSDADA